ncbi:hypothetical protein LguiA_035875 [Lonicera macranthoides]
MRTEKEWVGLHRIGLSRGKRLGSFLLSFLKGIPLPGVFLSFLFYSRLAKRP